MKQSPRRSLTGFTLVGLTALLGSFLAMTTAGCEAVLGTSDLHDEGAGSDAGPGGDDDDDGDDGAAPSDGGPDGSHAVPDATAKEGGASDAGGDATSGGEGGADGGEGGAAHDGGDGSAPEGGPAVNPSCLNNATAQKCGSSGNQDCCQSGAVEGDFYYRTYDDVGDVSDGIEVSGFVLDSYEVTVGRMRSYAAYLAGGGPLPLPGTGKHSHLNEGLGVEALPGPKPVVTSYEAGWLASYNALTTSGASASSAFANPTGCTTTYTATETSADNRPVNCVTWYDAYAFCIWDGGFLPTEGEWELAASGDGDQLDYPWGNTPAPGSTTAIFGCASESASCPAPVGTAFLGATATGQWDMMGNVAEWTLDDYEPTYADTDDCVDCAELSSGSSTKVDRGGAFSDTLSTEYLYPQGRGNFSPSAHNALAGFRCARAPK
jgi:formylglycine-generating enzyme required for sulfatase activity